MRANRQTNRQTYRHADYNTSHPLRGRSKIAVAVPCNVLMNDTKKILGMIIVNLSVLASWH